MKNKIMLTEIKKSINSVLYERTRSPLFGTLIVSWSIWNWKIVYLTLFVDKDKITGNKIDYITNNYSDVHHLVTFPLLSTAILLTIIPFASNGAYWLTIKFRKWRVDQKNEIEKKQLLTLEQSIELRETILEQESKFEKLLENKNLEIKQLNEIIVKLNSEKTSNKSVTQNKSANKIDDKELISLVERIKNNENELKEFDRVIFYNQAGYKLSGRQDLSSKFIALLESYDIISNKGAGVYQFTETGKNFLRLLNK